MCYHISPSSGRRRTLVSAAETPFLPSAPLYPLLPVPAITQNPSGVLTAYTGGPVGMLRPLASTLLSYTHIQQPLSVMHVPSTIILQRRQICRVGPSRTTEPSMHFSNGVRDCISLLSILDLAKGCRLSSGCDEVSLRYFDESMETIIDPNNLLMSILDLSNFCT